MFCKKNKLKGLIWILLLIACCLYLKFSWFSLPGRDNLLLLFTFIYLFPYGHIYSLIQSLPNRVRRYPVTVMDFDLGFFLGFANFKVITSRMAQFLSFIPPVYLCKEYYWKAAANDLSGKKDFFSVNVLLLAILQVYYRGGVVNKVL